MAQDSESLLSAHTSTAQRLLRFRSKMPRITLSRERFVTSLIALTVLILNMVWYFRGEQLTFLFRSRVMSTIEPNCESSLVEMVDTRNTSSNDTIPNIVHYVWLLNGRAQFKTSFKTFISIYSASLYFQPDIIYIHTDATPEQFEHAKIHGDESTRWTIAVPKVTYHQVTVPTHTASCVQILQIQHKSDFVRSEQLYKYGGVYLDTDIIPLRDIKPLRESGFANVFGNEGTRSINNGIMLARKGSMLMTIFRAEQHRVFNNRWTTHSISLLTALSYRMQVVPFEVLVLGKMSFSPSGWEDEEIDRLFMAHAETPTQTPSHDAVGVLPEVPTTFRDVVNYWNMQGNGGWPEWQEDYSGSYLIHAFDGTSKTRYWPRQVSLEYVLERQSNYARAVWPAVQHAIEAGIVDRKP